MKIEQLSFITPIMERRDKNIILDKSYSRKFSLLNEDKIFISSNVGNRDSQQDCVAVIQNGEYLLLLISDGVGGMDLGEQASYITADIIKQWLNSEDRDVLKLLNAKILEEVLNALIYFISDSIPYNSGATLNMSIITPKETFVVNIGDSRTYIIKDRKIKLITEDDSFVFREYFPNTSFERDILRFHKKNNIIINLISKNNIPYMKIIKINNDDYDILCHLSDGVTDILEERIIETYLHSEEPACELVNKSISGVPIMCLQEGDDFNKYIYPGKDNSTAIVYTKKRTK